MMGLKTQTNKQTTPAFKAPVEVASGVIEDHVQHC